MKVIEDIYRKQKTQNRRISEYNNTIAHTSKQAWATCSTFCWIAYIIEAREQKESVFLPIWNAVKAIWVYICIEGTAVL